jgi:pimeloyl-ACP methyl ester carboxylesterase
MTRFLALLTLVSIAGFTQTPRFTSYAISSDGVQIAYDVYAGTATTGLVFVHGWSCDRTYWTGQAGPFSKKYKVVTIDLAGHGGSGLNRRDYTMESFGADLAAVVNKLELQKVIFVGHSMGGAVILEAARLLPGRVAAVILVDLVEKLDPTPYPAAEVDTFITSMTPHFKDSAKLFVKHMFTKTADPKLVETIVEDMSSAPPTVALSALENTINYFDEIPAAIQELRIPTIVINADKSVTDMASMKKYGVKVEIQKGVGHFLMMEDAKGFNAILVRVLSGL